MVVRDRIVVHAGFRGRGFDEGPRRVPKVIHKNHVTQTLERGFIDGPEISFEQEASRRFVEEIGQHGEVKEDVAPPGVFPVVKPECAVVADEDVAGPRIIVAEALGIWHGSTSRLHPGESCERGRESRWHGQAERGGVSEALMDVRVGIKRIDIGDFQTVSAPKKARESRHKVRVFEVIENRGAARDVTRNQMPLGEFKKDRLKAKAGRVGGDDDLAFNRAVDAKMSRAAAGEARDEASLLIEFDEKRRVGAVGKRTDGNGVGFGPAWDAGNEGPKFWMHEPMCQEGLKIRMAESASGMYKSDMVTTGSIARSSTDALLGSVRLEVVFARRERLNRAWNYELCSPFWRLYVNRERGAELELAGRRMSLRVGVVYLLPARLRFHTRLAARVNTLWQDFIHFEVAGFPPALLRRLFPAPIALTPAPEITAPLSVWQAGLEAGAADLAQHLRATALVNAALAAACAQATSEGRAAWAAWLAMPPAVAPALRLIEDGLETPPRNEALAAACNLGVRQFLRRFRAAVGVSPAQYALERRVALAADALARGEEAVELIAARLGFADRFHFSKAFKARVGQPPAVYRRMHAAPRVG